MTAIPFVPPLTEPRYGRPVRLSPLVRRVIAENPTKYSYVGTGTYIIGNGDVAVIDPGPALDSHRDALLAALAGEKVRAILVTHCHSDHSPLAAWLRDETGAPTLAFGPHGSGAHTYPVLPDDPEDNEPDPDEPASIGEALDLDFTPDLAIGDGEHIDLVPGLTISGVYTPGHTANHLCFAVAEEQALFTGDHVMGWSTTVVSPPDGDMAAYLDSMRKVVGRTDAVLYPTHGNPVADPPPFLAAYLQHRLDREAEVLAQVRAGNSHVTDIVAVLYAGVRVELHKAAGRSVLSHLAKLAGEGQIAVDGGGLPGAKSTFVPA
jgi:glyoxylase-like metal-dependent hydrolase (beta-lactamase superfamily II)